MDSLLDVSSYGSAISVCEKGEQRQHALRLLVEMRRIDLLPDVISYNFAEVGQWQHALGSL